MNSKEFSELFQPKIGDEVVPWSEDPVFIGFSVLRNYKSDSGFVPAITRKGDADTKVLIKIGFSNTSGPVEKIPLILSASKHSKYQYSHFGIDFENPEAPTKESLDASIASKQPIDLEERTKFSVNLSSVPVSFLKESDGSVISLGTLVDYMYDLHHKTISGRRAILLKAKLGTRDAICGKIIPFFVSWLKKLMLNGFGKEIKDQGDFAVGIFKTYSFSKHVGTVWQYSLPYFNSSIKISSQNILYISITALYLWYKYFSKQQIGETFSVALIVVLVGVFEFAVPYILMQSINLLIILRMSLENRKFMFN